MWHGTQEEIDERINQISLLNIGDEVVSTIKSIDDMGFIVTLPAYHDVEGFVGMITNKKNYKVGKDYVGQVVRVDCNHGYLDLKIK